MTHQVFISYSNKDSPLAQQVCAALEANGLRCWIAPRDISKGTLWPEAIATALEECPVVVLIFTAHSNASPDVLNEIALATENNAARIVFQAEVVPPSKSLKYYLHVVQWLDATSKPLKAALRELVDAVQQALAARTTEPAAQSGAGEAILQPATGDPEKPATVPGPARSTHPAAGEAALPPPKSKPRSKPGSTGGWLSQHLRSMLASIAILALGGAILLAVTLLRSNGGNASLLPIASSSPTQTAALTEIPPEPTPPPTLAAATALPTTTASSPQKPAPPDCTRVDLAQGWQSPIDGMGMLCVPEGPFLMGLPQGDPMSRDGSDVPQRTVHLGAFWVDKTEVTNGMYVQFLNDIGALELPQEGGEPWLDLDSQVIVKENGKWSLESGMKDHPVVKVSWYGARAYCQWAGRHLLSEAQWEKSARGTDGRLYPWGSDPPSCKLANFLDCKVETGTTPVDTHSGGSPYGAIDMSGNVWEWVADWFDPGWYANLNPENKDPTGPQQGVEKVFRGGSFANEAFHLTTTNRDHFTPDFTDYSVGFRCGY